MGENRTTPWEKGRGVTDKHINGKCVDCGNTLFPILQVPRDNVLVFFECESCYYRNVWEDKKRDRR